jgi:hypothetical protein
MAEFLFDLRRASRKLPEDNTSRAQGGELVYEGKATRMGSAGTLRYLADALLGTTLAVGDFVNILLQVPETEHWYLRALGLITIRAGGTMTSVKGSFHVWKPFSEYSSATDVWSSPDLYYVPPRPATGLEPFAYDEQSWRQIAGEKSVAVAVASRFGHWIFDKDIWQRHIYAKEIILARIEVAAGGSSAAIFTPTLDVVRYPTPEKIISRMIQRDGTMRADVTLAGIIESEADRMSLED